jgi:hypothetical protein
MKRQVFALGAVLTAITGCISLFFINTALWAPGIFVAFFINGGHVSYLPATVFWSIAAAVIFFVYSALSWVLIVTLNRLREEAEQARKS